MARHSLLYRGEGRGWASHGGVDDFIVQATDTPRDVHKAVLNQGQGLSEASDSASTTTPTSAGAPADAPTPTATAGGNGAMDDWRTI